MDVVDVQLARVETSVDAMIGDLDHFEIGQCDLGQLARSARMAEKLRARLACFDADLAARRGELSRLVGERSVDNALDPQRQRPTARDRADRERAEVLDQFPGVDDATRAGGLPAEYADAIARAVRPLNDAQRAEFRRRHHDIDQVATGLSLHAFRLRLTQIVNQLLADCGINRSERQRQARRVRMWEDLDSGMGHLHAELDPETYARIKQTLESRADRLHRQRRDDPTDTRTHDQLAADAFTELLLTPPTPTTPGTDLIVLIDLDSLRNGLHDHGIATTGNGVVLPVDEIRRLACDANIIPVVLDGDGQALDVGRSKRLATPEQRTALRAMYPTCAIAGCDVPFDACEIHHLKPWEPPHDGPTDLNNLAPLCVRGANHHAQWHRHHWTGHINPTDRTLIVNYPDGTTEHHPLPRRAA